MAANIMTEILKQIQRNLVDQKEYMHMVHKNINEKFSLFDKKISDLDKKIDQQQVTIGKLKQQVEKNIVLLFGNDDKETTFEDETIVLRKQDFYDNHKKGHLVEQSDKCIQNTEANQQSHFKLADMYVTESSSKNKTDTDKDIVEEAITNEMPEVKTLITLIRDFVADRKQSYDEDINPVLKQVTEYGEFITNELQEVKVLITSIRESVEERKATVTIRKQRTEYEKFTTKKLQDIKELITSIRDSVAERKTSFEEATSPIRKQRIEFEEFTTKKLQEVKELITTIKDSAAERKTPIEEVGIPVREPEAVQISPAYFSAEQISKLNAELKRITEMHRSSDIFPIIEVIPRPCDEHPVMKRLRKGVLYKTNNIPIENFIIKLGTAGWKVSDIQDRLTDYPDLLLYDIVRDMLELDSRNNWNELSQKYDFYKPFPYLDVQ